MNIPSNLKYTNDHEWIRVEGSDAFIGVTDFAQGELGDIVYLDIESMGKSLKHGEVFGTVEAVKTVSDLFMPASGQVIEKNPMLSDKPELMNKDPYGEGWIIKVKLTNISEIDSLLGAEEYKKLIGA